MGLGMKKDAAGSFIPAVKFNLKDGKVICLDRVYESGVWSNKDRDVTAIFEAIMDLENLQQGWIKIQPGAAPATALVPVGEDPGDEPGDGFKMGVRVLMLMSPQCGDDLRELLNTSSAMWDAISDLHDQYLEEAPKHPGELPVVRLVKFVEQLGKQGKTYAPVFVIVGWTERPWEIPVPPKTPLPPPGTKTRPVSKAKKPVDDMADEIPW
jgi:hypothetical protein